MTKEEANNIIAENEAMVIGCTYNVLFTNDIVIGLTYEAEVAIKESPLYRYDIKRKLKDLVKCRLEYEKISNRVIGDKINFFADANDIFIKEVHRYINSLHSAIKKQYDKSNLKHSDVISKLELARILCNFSCVQLDDREKALCDKDIRFNNLSIKYLRLTKLYESLCIIKKALNIPCTVNLNTEECTKAINILSVKLADANTIAKAISA